MDSKTTGSFSLIARIPASFTAKIVNNSHRPSPPTVYTVTLYNTAPAPKQPACIWPRASQKPPKVSVLWTMRSHKTLKPSAHPQKQTHADSNQLKFICHTCLSNSQSMTAPAQRPILISILILTIQPTQPPVTSGLSDRHTYEIVRHSLWSPP